MRILCVLPSIVFILLLLNHSELTSCELMLYPSNLVSVCSGEQLSLMCSTNQSQYLRWTISLPHSITTFRTVAMDFLIGQSGSATEINNTTIRFFKISAVEAFPLESTLLINNVSTTFNGTRINCTEYGTTGITSEVTISIVETSQDSSSPPVIQAKPDSEQFSNNNVTVVIELTNKTRPKAPYVVTVVPREEEMQYAQLIIGSEDTEIQLTVLYNVQYNVSVTAIICGHRHESSNKIALHYAKCQYPQMSEFINIEGYSQPATEGNYITFGCNSSAFALIGPNTSTCMGNGQWEPDPREIQCKITCGPPSPPAKGYILNYSGTLEGATVMFVCNNTYPSSVPKENYKTAVCNQLGNWEPNPRDICKISSKSGNPHASFSSHNILMIIAASLAVVFVVAIICISFVWCFCFMMKKQRAKKMPESDVSYSKSAVIPIYEEVLPNPICYNQEKDPDPDLTKNMAYGPCTTTCMSVYHVTHP